MRYFSIEEANELVPLLQTTFQRVRASATEVAAITAQLLARGDRSQPGEPVPDELPADHRELRAKREQLVGRIRDGIGNLVELGIEVKRGDGLVDFRSRKGGRPVSLCWRYGEKQVSHWHELTEDWSGRRTIAEGKGFEPRYLN